MDTAIRPEWISILACLGSLLCFLAFRKAYKMQRSSLVFMFRIEMLALSPAMLVFGLLYGYFTITQVPIEIRQNLVRLLLLYLFATFDVALLFLLRWGRNL